MLWPAFIGELAEARTNRGRRRKTAVVVASRGASRELAIELALGALLATGRVKMRDRTP